MVAVPAVLGVASVRVYTVIEAPPGGLVSRDGVRLPAASAEVVGQGSFHSCHSSCLCLCPQLNIYAPLPDAAQFLPESPGVVERGLATAREGVLPLVQAVKVFELHL